MLLNFWLVELKKSSDFYYLADYLSAESSAQSLENIPYIIAASVFRGNHKNARRLYKEFKGRFECNDHIFVRFHLGLSFTRTSDYLEARRFFLENWRHRREDSLTGIEKFFIYQGLSFFRFFFSKHESSLYLANRAENELLKAASIPALLFCLVHDLISHNLYQLGKPAKAQKVLKKAISTAKDNGFEVLEKEFKASLLIYSSQYSIDIDKSIRSLKKLLKHTPESNDYTCSEIVLQIAKLYFLKGRYKDANDYIVANFRFIYENDNKRKVAKLNTLLAQLLLPKNQYIEALSLLKVAKNNLDENVDFSLLVPILGIEIQVLNLLEQNTSKQESELERLLQQTDKNIFKQVTSRKKNSPEFYEEDQLGALFNKAALKDESCLNTIVAKGALHIAKQFFSAGITQKTIIPHPKNEGIFLFSEEKILYRDEKLSSNQFKLLHLLSTRPYSKEELIESIWGYKGYDPLRHDHLIYTLVRRTRSLFGEVKTWIQSSENSYFLIEGASFVSSKILTERKKKIADMDEGISSLYKELNYRQLEIIEGRIEDGFSATQLSKEFGVTRMTAYRDLNELVQKKLLLKFGTGRATRYRLV